MKYKKTEGHNLLHHVFRILSVYVYRCVCTWQTHAVCAAEEIIINERIIIKSAFEN